MMNSIKSIAVLAAICAAIISTPAVARKIADSTGVQVLKGVKTPTDELGGRVDDMGKDIGGADCPSVCNWGSCTIAMKHGEVLSGTLQGAAGDGGGMVQCFNGQVRTLLQPPNPGTGP